MVIMKKKFYLQVMAVIMMICTALCFTEGCNQKENSGDISTGDTVHATEPQTTVAPETTQDPAAEALKNEVLELMEDDDGDKESLTTLFIPFCGDYTVGNFSKSNDFAVSLDSIYQKNGVSTIKYADGSYTHTVVRDGVQFSINEKDGKSELAGTLDVAVDSYVPSVFYDFGIDISPFYSGKGENTDDIEDPKLTADMLSVDAAYQICTFSDEYVREVARLLCASLDYNEAETQEFLSVYEGSGTYYAADKKVVFVIKGREKSIGDVTITLTYSKDDKGGEVSSVKTDFVVESGGMTIPTSQEIITRNVEYDGNKPVAASFELRAFASSEFSNQGVSGSVESTQISDIYLNIKDSDDICFDVIFTSTAATVIAGQKTESEATISLRKSDSKYENFYYTVSKDHIEQASLSGNLTFGTPDVPEPATDMEAIIKAELDKRSSI